MVQAAAKKLGLTVQAATMPVEQPLNIAQQHGDERSKSQQEAARERNHSETVTLLDTNGNWSVPVVVLDNFDATKPLSLDNQ
eukprot:5857572-Amphidinium_carterae.1